jgi:hypothetical protein
MEEAIGTLEPQPMTIFARRVNKHSFLAALVFIAFHLEISPSTCHLTMPSPRQQQNLFYGCDEKEKNSLFPLFFSSNEDSVMLFSVDIPTTFSFSFHVDDNRDHVNDDRFDMEEERKSFVSFAAMATSDRCRSTCRSFVGRTNERFLVFEIKSQK